VYTGSMEAETLTEQNEMEANEVEELRVEGIRVAMDLGLPEEEAKIMVEDYLGIY